MKTNLLTVLVLLFTTITNVVAQNQAEINWEYQAFPDLPFSIEHIQLDLHLQPATSLIQGAGLFKITSRRPDVTKFIFNTYDLDIQEISVQENKLDFLVSNDSLIIYLPDTLKSGEKVNLRIMWESSSHYGIHKDIDGNMWTSLNPGARHHWIPVPDHPEIETTLDANITLPADMEVVFNGRIIGDEIISTEEKMVHLSSEAVVPVTGMSLTVGNFQKKSARSGIKEVSVFSPENMLEEDIHAELLRLAVKELKNTENTFSFEFPYESLNIVVLPDHYWEEVQSGAGIIYLYQNLGSLSTQLKRGIVAQWLGNYHRYLKIPNNRVEFLRAAAIYSEINKIENPDSLQSIHLWNNWSGKLNSIENQFMLQTIQDAWSGFIQHFEGVVSWQDYASYWYDITGVFWGNVPKMKQAQRSIDKHLYTVTYQYDEMNNDLSLIFEAQNEPIESLIGIEATAFGFLDTTRSNFVVTGQLDTVNINIPEGIDYLLLTPEEPDDVTLVEYKPSMFLIRQLNSSEAEVKKQAAIQLRNNLDNPDLQLALNDALNQEENPEVRAELLQTLGLITDGAKGTEQTFLKMLSSESKDIQLAGLKALQNYPGNEQVIYAVQRILLQTEVDSIFKAALSTFGNVADLQARISIIDRLKSMEGKSVRTLTAIQAVAGSDSTEKALQSAEQYMLKEYPFEVRKQALQLLLKYKQKSEFWLKKLDELLADPDPRIRYHSLDGLKYLSKEDRDSIISDRLNEELDPRVLNKLQKKMKK